jgi:hypothetical protein
MTSPTEIAVDHQMAAEDADMPERIPDPVVPLQTDNSQPAAPAWIWQPGATAVDSPAEEPEVASRSDDEDDERAMPLTVPDAEPEPIHESSAASVAASPSMRWHEVLAMFVDDPRSSVELAAGLVDDSIQTLIASLKEQRDSLLAAWHDEDAGTEELRTAVQHYRAFGSRLADFPGETEPPAAPRMNEASS